MVRHLVDQTRDVFALFDPSGRLVEVHDPEHRRWNDPRSLTCWTDLAEPELEDAYRELWEQTRAGASTEWTTGSPDRVWRDALLPLRSRTGELEAVLFLARDETARHRAELAQRESEQRFQVLAEQVDFGIGLFGSFGLQFHNAALRQLFAVSDSETVGPDALLSRVHPGDRELLQRMWTLGGEEGRRTIRVHPRQGATRLVDVSVRSVELLDERFVLTSCSDVTDRERMLQSLFQKEKEESLLAIASGLAHDFNNILVSILSAASMLQDELPPDRDLQDLCAMITGGAERIASLSGKLLAYSRGGVFEPVPIDFNQVVRDSLELTRSSLEHVRLKSELPGSQEMVGDRAQLQQLVVSLLVNAGEATLDQGGTVEVRTERMNQVVRLQVSDDGSGMKPETQQRMFEPFFSTKFQGRGLGLAAAGGIIRNHHADVQVDSQPGAGTRICIDFPVQLDPRPPQVLIMDGDPMVVKVVTRLLAREGIGSVPAASLAEGLECLDRAEHRIKAVLTDASLIDAGGPEVIRSLRHRQPELPLVICSGHTKEWALSGVDEGVLFGFLRKPFKSEELVGLMHQALTA